MTNKSAYSDNFKKSSEFLRLTVALMARHQIPSNPHNYQIAYDYVSGSNKALKEDFDKLIAQGQPSEQQLWSLYKQYFVRDGSYIKAMRKEIRHIITTLLDEFGYSGGQLSNYSHTLHQFIDILDADTPSGKMLKETEKVIEETHAMEQSQKHFEKQIVSVMAEIDTLRKELDQVKEESKIDTLTGISNRKAFDAKLEHTILKSRENNKPFSLLILDIDHFKKFNDTYGHLVGDKVLRYVAGSFKDNVKGNDFVARFGGEEFAIILPDTNINGALIVSQQIREAISAGKLTEKGAETSYGRITISIGTTQFRASDLSHELLSRADKALYLAKERGRNRVEKL